jgi:hypothetical protein
VSLVFLWDFLNVDGSDVFVPENKGVDLPIANPAIVLSLRLVRDHLPLR